jgi:3-deoxy-D-manno-octulosonate 8-phosphate phosphatase (KDO 8-P phosphatase)
MQPTTIITDTSPAVFLLDVDGVMTDGKFYYTADGKFLKAFGPDDHDALSLLKPHLEIVFVTGDKRGFDISKARIIDDMKMRLELVSTIKRLDWIKDRWDPATVIYMGDGIFDNYVFEGVGYSIAPANADQFAKDSAKFVTKRSGGDRAVAEASLHILETFFNAFKRDLLPEANLKLSGQWGV